MDLSTLPACISRDRTRKTFQQKKLKPAEKQTMPAPEYANSGITEGPLGPEDAENFHP